MSAIQAITNYVYGAESSFQGALADHSLNFEREAGFAIQILTSGDYIAKLAAGDRQSVVNAVTNIAAIGISLNPAKKQAYLVPRKGKVCLDISYMGLIDLAIDSGSIMWAQAELVCAGDAFALNGFDKPPTHSYNPFSQDRGEVAGAYVVVKTHTGDYLTTCMSKADIDAIKNRSESVKAGKTSPWDTDYGEMAKKTVVKRAYKYWPKSERLDQAIHHLNTEGGEGLATLATPAPAPAAEAPPALLEKADAAAKKGTEVYKHFWKSLSATDRQLLAGHHITLKNVAATADAQITDVEAKNEDMRSSAEN
ncbi:recombinase RecT [Comamonas sp. MYb396]|uniref:recombinase RecT n=1 Tax=Comamonas sp. MYb396 TaxID=2745302 RepID=UPI0030AD4966